MQWYVDQKAAFQGDGSKERPFTKIQNAASIAAMVLTTETLVADKPEKNPPMPAGGGMGGGMPGMM